ncbi:DNA polymerase-3 subunit gamma/tau [Natronincola peptidivorans]|uniref:DNA-directed DNA polymerase n=1 Tax=Natronincola peptidivorans TaxID=426128 RepID=A0A1I0GN34_9FIRM|nr:DNA polymerase III subunit gamma/tau [Natronincola peptidivorans]SET71812.1 DNA polymerase-3 subunit gamma/tau [Natronincola peptidivorans]
MAYKALYRKFRPQVFEDVVGQNPITTTLKNQIKAKSISHAYLFSGTRGTGKTSTAKIFARAVNCLQPEDFNPCNQCEVCKGILTESIMDVVEIDAASNNGVDHIRELRENVKYPPSKGSYKIYIIDEVHMLSTGAFNALLKTLEEPPNHVIFILATTDPQKLPATILSRCQRYDFKGVTTKAIIERLKEICSKLEVDAEEEALRIIAINAGGALRDALSILEQCISFTDGKLTEEEVIDTLGLVNHQMIFSLVEAIAKKNTSEAIHLIQKIVGEGKDVQQLIKELVYHFRNLMMAKINVELEELLSLSKEVLEKLQQQSKSFSINGIKEAINILSELEGKAKYAAQPKILLEVAAVSLCIEKQEENVDSLIERVLQLEKKIASGKSAFKETSLRETYSTNIVENPVKKIKTVEKAAEEESLGPEKTEKEEIESSKEEALDFSALKDGWQEVKDFIKRDKKAQVEAMLKEGNIEGIKGNRLIISFKDGYGFHRETLDKEKNKEYIASIIKKVTGQNPKLSFVMEYEINEKQKNNDEEIIIEKLKKVLPEGLLEIVDE